jgi:Tfp pilus assembly protein PilZ
MSEKRKEKRLNEENKVTISVLSKDKSKHAKGSFYALTKDISLNGIKIHTDVKLDIGTELKIEMALAKSKKLISVIGRVKWQSQLYDNEVFEMGVEFMDTPPDRVLTLLEHLYGEKRNK